MKDKASEATIANHADRAAAAWEKNKQNQRRHHANNGTCSVGAQATENQETSLKGAGMARPSQRNECATSINNRFRSGYRSTAPGGQEYDACCETWAVQFSPLRDEVGNFGADPVETAPALMEVGPNSAQLRSKSTQAWPSLVERFPMSGAQVWSIFRAPDLAEGGRESPGLADLGSKSAPPELRPGVGQVSAVSADVGHRVERAPSCLLGESARSSFPERCLCPNRCSSFCGPTFQMAGSSATNRRKRRSATTACCCPAGTPSGSSRARARWASSTPPCRRGAQPCRGASRSPPNWLRNPC